MLRYHFREKKNRDFDFLVTGTGQLTEEESESCDELFERAYRQVAERVQPHMKPEKCAAYRELSKRAVQRAWFLSANITINVEKGGEGVILLETDAFLLAGGDREEYIEILSELFLAADDVSYFVWENELPKLEFTFALYDTTEQWAAV